MPYQCGCNRSQDWRNCTVNDTCSGACQMECKQNCFQLMLSNKVNALEKFSSSRKILSSLGIHGRYCSNVCVRLFKGCVSAVQILNSLTFCVHRHDLFKNSGLHVSVCNLVQKSGTNTAPCSRKLSEFFIQFMY